MKFEKFKILNIEDNAPVKENVDSVILNMDHIISIKQINILIMSNIVQGYWIRLSNGKKYKALEIPLELKKLLETSDNKSNIEKGQEIVFN